MSFDDSSDFDNVLGMIYDESSTIPPSHSKKVVPVLHPLALVGAFSLPIPLASLVVL